MTVAVVEPAEAPQLLAYARRLRWLLVRRAALDAGKLAAVVLAVPTLALVWLLPAIWPALAVAALLLVAVRAVLAGANVLVRADHRLLAGLATDDVSRRAQFTRLGDELATWLEVRDGARGSAMVAWLAQDVARQLPEVLPKVGAAARRPLGRWLWLLPLLIVLLLAWLLSAWLTPPWPGVLGGGSGVSGAGGGGSGPGEAGGGGEGGGQRPDDPQRDPRRPASPPANPPQQDEPEPPPEVAPEPPAPLLDLPSQQQFLIPEFVGDGPTTRVRMHAAEVEQGAPNGATGRSEGASEAPPVPPAQRFERAAEQALQSRHVPPAEQAMVRRFFEALREAGK